MHVLYGFMDIRLQCHACMGENIDSIVRLAVVASCKASVYLYLLAIFGIPQMPTDQGRRHPAHHFGGFLGLALHRAKSKSTEHLHPESRQHKKLDKRVLSSRDLASGFDNVLAEQPKFRKSEEEIRSPAALAESKRYTGDSVPFAIKYAVSKDTTTKLAMSVTAASASTQSQSDPDMLDQALSNIRMKLVSCTV